MENSFDFMRFNMPFFVGVIFDRLHIYERSRIRTRLFVVVWLKKKQFVRRLALRLAGKAPN
ncbi:hypothetical protein RJ45_13220 [Photobacterium gaetbulicola]|uniref:Uncharacterized protein n=1 Tax=Photobacterium gaetbulicola TaxID=1295392 RepID=A0A0B9GF17_9GAMM|nr:hypothetical protein RJ45_13220 [Photobacterium gaetbulicola]